MIAPSTLVRDDLCNVSPVSPATARAALAIFDQMQEIEAETRWTITGTPPIEAELAAVDPLALAPEIEALAVDIRAAWPAVEADDRRKGHRAIRVPDRREPGTYITKRKLEMATMHVMGMPIRKAGAHFGVSKTSVVNAVASLRTLTGQCVAGLRQIAARENLDTFDEVHAMLKREIRENQRWVGAQQNY